MTRKDYVEVAKILGDNIDYTQNKIVQDFIEMFKKDNPRFDANRFIDAVYANGVNTMLVS